MPGPVIKAKLLKWGNSYGLRIAKADVERLELHPGEEVEVTVGGRLDKVDISHIRMFHWGGGGARHHDQIRRRARKAARNGT